MASKLDAAAVPITALCRLCDALPLPPKVRMISSWTASNGMCIALSCVPRPATSRDNAARLIARDEIRLSLGVGRPARRSELVRCLCRLGACVPDHVCLIQDAPAQHASHFRLLRRIDLTQL